jgi:solute carrier family 13 (sodium-dependent dicarboxylate transporter), member 2/3/5
VQRHHARSPSQRLGFWGGAALFGAMLALEPAAGFSAAAWHAGALAMLMAVWWATEALPIAATSMVPLAGGPLLGIVPIEEAGHAYGSSTIFLILGGCLLAIALERWQLHRRLAFAVLSHAGASARGLVLGVMSACAFVSMWVSNTSTTLMMLPVATSIIALIAPDPQQVTPDQKRFGAALVLGVAYASTIGGLGTLIGTPTNALAAGFMSQTYGVTLSFADWLIFGMPCVLLLLPLAWWSLVGVTHRFDLPDIAHARAAVAAERRSLGRLAPPERRVAFIGCAAAGAWVASPWLRQWDMLANLSDMVVAMLAGLALFATPSGSPMGGRLLDAADFRRVPWDTLFLFGGGLALAALIQSSGLSGNIGELLAGLAGWPTYALTAAVVLIIVFWTELSSNVATAATFMPVLAAMAAASGIPVLQLVAPAAIAASCGFMLPVGTAPNAIVYGSGRVELRDMMRAGLVVDMLAVVIVVGMASATLRWVAV